MAENYRYEDAFHEACRLAPSVLGTVIKLDLVADLTMDPNNKCVAGRVCVGVMGWQGIVTMALSAVPIF